jgi:chemotaxis signal transduction protein
MEQNQAPVAATAAASTAAVPSAPRIALRPHDALPWLLLPQGVALEILIDASAIRVPNTNTWFHGVVSQRGNLLPIFDLSMWAGLHPAADRQRQVVVVGLESRLFGVLSDTTPALLHIEDTGDRQATYNGPLSPYLSHIRSNGREEAYEFDASAWLSRVSRDISRTGSIVKA